MPPVNDMDLLRRVELFDLFAEDDHRRLLDATEAVDLIRNDVVFEEGAEADACYVVVDGRIAISNKSFDGRESMVALMERGDLFGEMSLFDGLGRSAEARALEPSQVIHVPYDVLQAIWEDKPELLWSVVRLLSQRLRSMDEALADSFFLDVTGRTAKHLLELAGRPRRVRDPDHPGGARRPGRRLTGAGQQGDRQLPAARLDRAERPHLPDPQAPRARDPLQ